MHLALKVDSLIQHVYAGGSRIPPYYQRFDRGNELDSSWWMESFWWDSGLAPTSEVFFVLRVSEHRRWEDGLTMKQWWNNGEGVEVNQRGGWWKQKQWWSLIQTSIISSVRQTNEETRAKMYFNRLSGLLCTCMLCLTSYLHSLNRPGRVFFYIVHCFFHLFMEKNTSKLSYLGAIECFVLCFQVDEIWGIEYEREVCSKVPNLFSATLFKYDRAQVYRQRVRG